jgi:hypothetical protein
LSLTLLFWIQRALMSFWIGLVKKTQGTHKSDNEFIKLTTPYRNELEYVAEPVVKTKGDANHVAYQ